MKRLFHGTTLDNWNNILKEEGFASDYTNWICSSDNETYFYDTDKTDYEELDEQRQFCIHSAFESAALAASISNYLGTDLIVLELEVPDEFCEDDWSAENMGDIATVVNNGDLDLEMITNVYIAKNGYLPSLRLLYCYGLIQSNNPHIKFDRFNQTELNIMRNTQFPHVEDVHEFEWDELDSVLKLEVI